MAGGPPSTTALHAAGKSRGCLIFVGMTLGLPSKFNVSRAAPTTISLREY
jgi:hypothetical protein